MDENMETLDRRHGHMDEDMATWMRTWKHGRGHGNMDEDQGCGTGKFEDSSGSDILSDYGSGPVPAPVPGHIHVYTYTYTYMYMFS
jgi:hypothetical protein